jgi:16S rRNA processing protein RimM
LLLNDGSILTVARFEATERSPIVTFEEVNDRTAAESRRGMELYIRAADRRTLGDDEFWPDELVGMEAVTPEGVRIGEVIEVEPGVGQDRLVIDTPSGAVRVPFVAALIPEVDRAERRIVADLPPGLME